MDLKSLVQVPEAQRNQAWENQFFQTLSQSQLSFMSMEPQTGPDGWPYMLMRTEGDQQESFQKLLFWLSTRGIGLVINPGKEYPDYVFTYGMLWHFRETGFFFMPVPERNHGVVEFHPQEVVNAGPPTEKYLPSYVRQVLRDFFRDQGILRPKILVMSTDNINYDLAISLESLKNPPEQEHQGIAEAIGWFLPPHYSILLVSENGLPSFGDL